MPGEHGLIVLSHNQPLFSAPEQRLLGNQAAFYKRVGEKWFCPRYSQRVLRVICEKGFGFFSLFV